jgi:hypothetical protein
MVVRVLLASGISGETKSVGVAVAMSSSRSHPSVMTGMKVLPIIILKEYLENELQIFLFHEKQTSVLKTNDKPDSN